MHAAGIRGDTISYTAMINACGRAGDVTRAEQWLERMLEAGAQPNVITFNAVVSACAKAGAGPRCEQWIEKMIRSGVKPNSFTYNSAAKPYLAKGNYTKVESLINDMRNSGLCVDDFCLTTLLHAYGNARPKQRQRAEDAFKQFVAEGVSLTNTSMQALQRTVGRAEAQALWQQSCANIQRASPSGTRGKTLEKTMIKAPPGLEHSQASVINASAYDWD